MNKTEKILVLCLLSWVFDTFDGIYLILNTISLLDPAPDEFNYGMKVIIDILWFADNFWTFGFPIFFGSLFTKTRRTVWWVWAIAITSFIAGQVDVLAWRELIEVQWWENWENWIWNSISFLTTMAWIFYGGLIVRKLTNDIDFSKFESSSTLTYLKEWYTNLIK